MAKVYANLIINGRRTIDDVTEKNGLRDEVKAELIARGYPELAGVEPTVEATN